MIADRIIAFLDGLSSEELQKLPPAAGGSPFPAVRRLKETKPGVLSRLKDGERGE